MIKDAAAFPVSSFHFLIDPEAAHIEEKSRMARSTGAKRDERRHIAARMGDLHVPPAADSPGFENAVYHVKRG